MAKTKFFQIFTEGDTTDGRVILRQWIEDMAATYNPKLYGARIWMEHMRSMYPDSAFKAYGDVLAVEARKVDSGKLALFAQLDPTPELIAMNKARQKIYTSAEVQPDFAKTGKAYLVGLAVTDSPASLGTEMLAFAAQAPTNPLAARKQDPNNLFTAAFETTFEIEETPEMTTKTDAPDLLTQIKALFTPAKPETPPAKPEAAAGDHTAAVLEIATQVKASADAFTAQLAAATKAADDKVAAFTKQLEDSTKAFTELKTAHEKLLTDFTALSTKLDTDPATGEKRPDATGGNSGAAIGY